jgi:threonyl-tRNA synthetase
MLKTLGLDGEIAYRFSKWDPANKEKYIGSAEDWENVQGLMKTILDDIGLDYTEADGEAAFYGPKLDMQIKNVHGKEDTLITIQIDFQLAKSFGMEYVDSDGTKKLPYIIHRTSIGCYERVLAMLIEHYAGALPLWLAPVQVAVLPITDRAHDYAQSVAEALISRGFRVETDTRNEKIGYKIREAQMQKIPYMLVLGDKEAELGSLAVRSRSEGDLGATSLDEFIAKISAQRDGRE